MARAIDDVWVLGDTTPKDYQLGGDDLTGATAVVAAMSNGGATVAVTATVVDADTVRLTRTGLALTAGVWRLEVEATFPSGVQTFPEASPHVVRVRDDIAPGA